MSAVLTGNIVDTLQEKFGREAVIPEQTKDAIPTFWTSRQKIREILVCLKSGIQQPYKVLYDLTAIDERARKIPQQQPASGFTVVYHLLSFDRNAYVRVKVPLREDNPSLDSITPIWPSANWYEREVWDMFGITFSGHPHLRRLIMPNTWTGHPLQKNHPARATEMGPFTLTPEKEDAEQEAMQFHPEDFGMQRVRDDADLMFLNVGPQHPGTHGILRIVLQLDGEEIVDAVPLIGFHHRGAEKMGERQSWHTYIPYTDRVDYLGGVMNNLAYLTAVEKLGGIHVPPRRSSSTISASPTLEAILRANGKVWVPRCRLANRSRTGSTIDHHTPSA